MKAIQKSLIMRGMVLFHYVVMVAMFIGCWRHFYGLPIPKGAFSTNSLAVCSMYAALLIMLNRVYAAYKVGLMRVSDLIYSQTIANLVGLAVTYVLASVLAHRILNPLAGFGVAVIQALFSASWTILANRLYFALNKPKRTVVIYRNKNDLNKLEEIRFFTARWNVERRVQWLSGESHDIPQGRKKENDVGTEGIHELIKIMEDYEAVFVSGVNATLRNGIVKYCVEKGKACYFVPHTGDVIISGAEHIRSFAVPICRAGRCLPPPEYLFVKRAMDIILSLIAILVASPLMILTALAIYGYDRGPILYRQVRLTKDGKPFKILKFRSMRVDAESDGIARLASEHDHRITPIGHLIRSIRFDEMPQLFNILKGDMSIVGPRPERPEIAELYRQELPAFDLRLQVKAGLTGYAQVYGRYNTEPQDKLKMDLMYINHASIAEDVKLILATIRVLFMKDSTEGIGEGHTTASVISDREKSA